MPRNPISAAAPTRNATSAARPAPVPSIWSRHRVESPALVKVGISSTLAGNTCTILFDRLLVELNSDRAPLHGVRVCTLRIPYKLPDDVLLMSLMHELRGAVSLDPGCRASLAVHGAAYGAGFQFEYDQPGLSEQPHQPGVTSRPGNPGSTAHPNQPNQPDQPVQSDIANFYRCFAVPVEATMSNGMSAAPRKPTEHFVTLLISAWRPSKAAVATIAVDSLEIAAWTVRVGTPDTP